MRGWGRVCAVGLLSAWLSAAAQTASPPPGVVPTPIELAPKPLPSGIDPGELPRRPPPRELGKPDGELAIDVTRYEVADDAPQALKDHLAELTRPYVGPGRSYEEVQNAAVEVTRFLQSELGYYLGYAYLPEQSPQAGVVRIAILEGRLDRVVLHWSDGLPVDRAVVEGYLAQLKPDSVLRVRDVERIVFLINDLRGITARFEVEAGSRPGTALLVVTPVADHRASGRVDADANGSSFLGKYRLSGLVTVNSPFGRGDGLTANLLASNTRGLEFALLGYTTPVGSNGLKIGSSLSVLHYQLDKQDFPQDLHGDSLAATAYALYPNIRSRNLNLFTLLSLEQKNYRDMQAEISTPKNVTSVSLGVSGDARDAILSGGVDTYDMSLAVGRVQYPDGRPGGLLDSAHYGKVDFTFSRLQNILTSRLLLYGLLHGQYALQNLDTTEQFRLGGSDGIRAYAPGDGTGDSGVYATLELRLLPSPDWLGPRAREFVFGLFYDYGELERRHDTSQESSDFVNTDKLAGAGLALTWEGAEGYAVHSSLAMRTEHAQANDPNRRLRLYLQLTKTFR
jgi:hemolysin activation/secretion protein